MEEHKHRFLCFGISRVLRPDIKLQAIFRRGIAVLRRKVLPHTQARGLREVGEGAHWWLV